MFHKDSGRLPAGLSIIGMGGAGLLHFWVMPEHWAHAPAHGIVFLFLGIAQFVWIILFLRRGSLSIYKTGVILAGASIFLWALTRIFPAPFEQGPEAVSVDSLLVKLFEGLSISGLALIILHNSDDKIRALRTILMLGVSAFMIALVVYTGGRIVEPVFPMLKGKANYEHTHQEGHSGQHHH